MQLLVSTIEAANHLGISVQGVHYRIKTKKLNSIKKDGKTFVYIDSSQIKQQETQEPKETLNNEIVKLKDEQIGLLKKAIKWLKNQHKSEIKRLEKNHNKVIEIFKSEVELLQKAYNEMQTLYKNANQNLLLKEDRQEITIKEFFVLMKSYDKSNEQIKRILLDRIKSGDKRFQYRSKKITIYKNSFKDLV